MKLKPSFMLLSNLFIILIGFLVVLVIDIWNVINLDNINVHWWYLVTLVDYVGIVVLD
jgi:hypothetical protein